MKQPVGIVQPTRNHTVAAPRRADSETSGCTQTAGPSYLNNFNLPLKFLRLLPYGTFPSSQAGWRMSTALLLVSWAGGVNLEIERPTSLCFRLSVGSFIGPHIRCTPSMPLTYWFPYPQPTFLVPIFFCSCHAFNYGSRFPYLRWTTHTHHLGSWWCSSSS